MSILLTLAMQSLNSSIEADKIDIKDVPRLSEEKFALRGIMLDATHLSGWSLDAYDQFRNNADKANSPCLLLRDNSIMDLSPTSSEESKERINRLSIAANRLGCNSIAITPHFPENEEESNYIVQELRSAMQGVERLELNLLLQPCNGMTSDPSKHIEIIKQIGGFRIGALPTFASASATGNGLDALQKLAPYAGAIVADFPPSRGKGGFSFEDGIKAVADVGYSNTVALNYIGKGNPLPQLSKVSKKMHAFLEAME